MVRRAHCARSVCINNMVYVEHLLLFWGSEILVPVTQRVPMWPGPSQTPGPESLTSCPGWHVSQRNVTAHWVKASACSVWLQWATTLDSLCLLFSELHPFPGAFALGWFCFVSFPHKKSWSWGRLHSCESLRGNHQTWSGLGDPRRSQLLGTLSWNYLNYFYEDALGIDYQHNNSWVQWSCHVIM